MLVEFCTADNVLLYRQHISVEKFVEVAGGLQLNRRWKTAGYWLQLTTLQEVGSSYQLENKINCFKSLKGLSFNYLCNMI